MHIVHEKSIADRKDSHNPKTHAWAYHPNLSIENVGAVFQAQNLQSSCPILSKFLQQVCLCMLYCDTIPQMYFIKEHVLRATQYIPDIFKLQQLLYQHFNHRLDRTVASSKSIGDFVKQVSG